MTARRARGEGSVYFDAQRKRWVGVADLGIVDGKRVRRKVSAPTRTDARRKLAELLAQAANGGSVPRADLTVRQVVEELLANPPGGWKSPISMQVNRNHCQRITDALGSVKVARLTAAQVEKFLRSLVGQGYSTSTIAKTKGVLRLALRRAQRDHRLVQNVAELADTPDGTERKSRSMTVEQVQKLLALELSPWWKAYMSVAFGLGLRPGEMHGLRWEDVETDAGTLSIRRSLKREGGALVLADLKTASSRRTLAMPPEVAAALKAHQVDQLKRRMKAGASWQEQGLVFSSRSGGPRTPLATYARFRKLCELAGIGSDWTLHEMRHTFVSVLSHHGATIEAIADAAGHVNSRVTQTVYRHSLTDVVATAAAWHFGSTEQAQEVQA